MSDRPRFCEGCPYVPDGVIAEVSDVDVLNMGRLSRYRFAREDPETALAVTEIATITSVVAEISGAKGVELGDEATMQIHRHGRDRAEIMDAIRDCPGPQRSRIQKALGSKGVCLAVTRC